MAKNEPKIVHASVSNKLFTTEVEGLVFTIDQQIHVDEVDNFEPDLEELKKVRHELEHLDDDKQVAVLNGDFFEEGDENFKKAKKISEAVIMTYPLYQRIDGVMSMVSKIQGIGFYE